jgi:hypothetical protein
MSRRPLPAPAGADDVRGVLASRYRHDDDQAAEDDAATPGRQDATAAERPEVTAPRRQRTATPRRSEAVTPRRREGRPSATAETTIATTVRLSVDESYAQRALLLDLARRGRIKQLDRSEVDRVLWRLLADDAQLQARVLGELG